MFEINIFVYILCNTILKMLIKLVVKIYSLKLVSVYQGYTLIVFYDSGVLNGKKVENHWSKGYLPTLQKHGKWRISWENLSPGQLVLVRNVNDFLKCGSFCLGYIHWFICNFSMGKNMYIERHVQWF